MHQVGVPHTVPLLTVLLVRRPCSEPRPLTCVSSDCPSEVASLKVIIGGLQGPCGTTYSGSISFPSRGVASVARLAHGRAAADEEVTGRSLSQSGVVPMPDYSEFGKH